MMTMKKMKLDESKFAREEGTSKTEDPVNKMRYGDNRRIEKGVPIACACGAAVAVATCKSPDGRDERYFMCGYDLSNEAGEVCGFKRALEKALLEEIALIKGEKTKLQERVDEANKKIDEDKGTLAWMQVQYEEMMAEHKTLEDYDGEISETQISLAQITDRNSALERKVVSLEKNLDREMMMLRRYGEVRTKDKGVPRGCDCGHAVIVETEKEPLNGGKMYFLCPYGVFDGCGFKRWWVQTILEEFKLIKQDKETMTKALEETNEKNEELGERVQAGEDDGTMEQNVVNITRKLGQSTEQVNELARKYEWLEKEFMKLDIYL